MSYNIDSTHVIRLDAKILEKDLRRIAKKYRDDLPEGNLIEEHADDEPDADGYITLREFWWYSEGSGRSYEPILVNEIAPLIVGEVEIVFTWEGGDNHSGLLIKDGKVTTCDAEIRCVKPEGW